MRRILAILASLVVLAGCGKGTEVSYQAARADGDSLAVYAGPGDYREIIARVAPDARLVDDPADADLLFHQRAAEFQPSESLSVVARVGVVPYALYSAKWTDLKETASWVNMGIVEDEVNGKSLPHGSKIVLPGAATDFARGLYLLQSAGLVKLDRPFGGSTQVDLTIDEAHVTDSLRHLSLLGLYTDDRLSEVYQQFDALVLNPAQAVQLGLDPVQDALAVEPGPGNPWASVLVAPSRLAGDPRVLALTHALESPSAAAFLTSKHQLPAS